ncbi:MAG: hypothetical protein KA054_03920 [Candidatus Moranbacteria bacterium]|nr:hypothetical protein [Candidatus Moranbacteria bacterium]
MLFMEMGIPHEMPVSAGVSRVELPEYSADELEEIGNELQICLVLAEGSDMLSWITADSENFRNWLNSEDGRSSLRAYLSEYPVEKIQQRADRITEQYEHPENLKSLIVDDSALASFVSAFRKEYPRAAESAESSDGHTIH